MYHRSNRLCRIGCSVTAAIVLFLHSANAQTSIAGDISGMTFDSSGNPYVIEREIFVSEGKSAVVNKGCVFLFKPFTGLNVYGDLAVKGTREHPVVFTTINDNVYNSQSEQPSNPFDWNGILVTKESKTVSLSYFILRFSVYGVKSQNTNIVIDNGQFRENGQFHFTINDKIHVIKDDIPFSWNTGEVQPPKDTALNVFVNKGVPAIFAGAGVVSGVVSLVYLSKWLQLEREYRGASDPASADKVQQDGEFPSQVAIGTGAFSVAAIAAGALLYWWWNGRANKPVAILPVILPERTGATICIVLRH